MIHILKLLTESYIKTQCNIIPLSTLSEQKKKKLQIWNEYINRSIVKNEVKNYCDRLRNVNCYSAGTPVWIWESQHQMIKSQVSSEKTFSSV